MVDEELNIYIVFEELLLGGVIRASRTGGQHPAD